MKSKIVVLIIILIIILPVAYVGMRELRHRGARHAAVKKVKPPVPFTFRININDSSLKGYLLISPYELNQWRHGRIIIMDMKGNKYVDRYIKGAVYCFRQWHINGKIYYSYIVDDPRVPHIKKINLTAGHVVLLDSALNEIKQLHLIPHGNIIRDRNQDLDLHDLVMLSENHFITVATYEKTVTNIPDSFHASPYIKVGAPVIQEIVNDSVIWQWDATDYPEFYATSAIHNQYNDTTRTQDYMHINSAVLDPKDGNIVASFRSTDQVVKINRQTGNIMWRLGGKNSDFNMKDGQKFLRQHNAVYTPDGMLTLLDNGDSTLRQTSRVLQFRLDEQKKKIILFSTMNIPENYAQYMGNVEQDGENYFIGGGSANYILEINKKGEKHFELIGNQASYRAYKVDSIYGLERQKAR